jgi:NAD(P)-dependent dehydrogenase (short-subunit alcohol dehydrogenase family)
MRERRYGRVINVGSTLSIVAIPERTPYATSKGGVLQLTRALAIEWAPYNVTVNAILPGPFATEMNVPLLKDPEVAKRFTDMVPLGRWGELEEVGGLALFLASDASSFVTGAAITVDGGWTAR